MAVAKIARGRSKFVLALLILVTLACLGPYDPYAHLLTTKEPDTADVTGLYILTEQTLTEGKLNFLQGKQATIELKPDGTATLSNFPLWLELGMSYKFDRFLSGTDRWQVERVGLLSSGDDIWGIGFSQITSASLTGDQPPYGLIFTYGDPDSGDVMIFEKVP